MVLTVSGFFWLSKEMPEELAYMHKWHFQESAALLNMSDKLSKY